MKNIQIKGIGEVQFKKSKRAKRVNIRVKPNQPVQVSVPQRVSFRQAQKVLEKHLDWVKKHQAKLNEKHQKELFEVGSSFKTKTKTVCIKSTPQPEPYLTVEEQQMTIFIPEKEDIKAPKVQDLIKLQIIEQLRREAKDYVVPRTRALAERHRIRINKITIKKVKTRWGSCSNKDNINLSLFLMLLPDRLIDYVILHELAHVKEKNHSPAFWQHLETLFPNAKVWDKKLKDYSIEQLL